MRAGLSYSYADYQFSDYSVVTGSGATADTVAYDGNPTDVSVDAARLSGQLFSEVRAAERPCAKYQ